MNEPTGSLEFVPASGIGFGNVELMSNFVAARLARADVWGGGMRALLATAASRLFGSAVRNLRRGGDEQK